MLVPVFNHWNADLKGLFEGILIRLSPFFSLEEVLDDLSVTGVSCLSSSGCVVRDGVPFPDAASPSLAASVSVKLCPENRLIRFFQEATVSSPNSR